MAEIDRTDAPKGLGPFQIFGVKDGEETTLQELLSTVGALHVFETSHMEGGRFADDATTGKDHQVVAGEWKAVTVSISGTGDATVYSGPCVVRAVRVRKATDAGVATSNTAGVILLKDGSVVKEGSAAGATPGTVLYDGAEGVQFRTSVVLNFASASDDDKIEVLYRPMPATVTW